MASFPSLRMWSSGDMKYLLNGSEFVCELPDWVDFTARITTRFNPEINRAEIYLAQPNKPLHVLDQDDKKWRPV